MAPRTACGGSSAARAAKCNCCFPKFAHIVPVSPDPASARDPPRSRTAPPPHGHQRRYSNARATRCHRSVRHLSSHHPRPPLHAPASRPQSPNSYQTLKSNKQTTTTTTTRNTRPSSSRNDRRQQELQLLFFGRRKKKNFSLSEHVSSEPTKNPLLLRGETSRLMSPAHVARHRSVSSSRVATRAFARD
jgi:hypothetical protein